MSELWGIARFKFHEGKLEEFKRLSVQAMEIVRTKDTGTLQYDVYFNDDQSECVVLERYRDSEAAIEHASNLGDLFEAVLATVTVVHGEILGEPSAELREKLAGSEVPVLFTPLPVDVATARRGCRMTSARSRRTRLRRPRPPPPSRDIPETRAPR